MDEFSFIKSIKQQFYRQSTLVKGIGDDAAVFRQPFSDIVTSVDTFVENIHFRKDTMKPFHVGYRALTANISDIAAMGATPAFYLVSIVIPTTWCDAEIDDVFRGMHTLASNYKMDLIGGDTVSGSELTISITVIGYARKGSICYRHNARDGDIVFATGTLGDSQAGYYILTNPGDYMDADYYIRSHQMPEPQVNFASYFHHFSRVAINDISDGIGNEAAEICAESNVSMILEDEQIPISDNYHQFLPELQYKWKYFGGEDFQLLGTISANDWPKLKKVADSIHIRLTRIGRVFTEDNQHNVYLKKNGRKYLLPKKGYTHLK
ncbi:MULTISPECIES: thiamine-phosphate kinase [Virgibacillus]|uniref:Thiamine-monophosphate kinase n=2 Tax=Virgibacillus TaxID=84406 RepID=A0A024QGV8_9BACI|nr:MULTISPECIES: thiamine-phosphate kinase [Virgibacillus]EQB34829.1 hypothetical protein M948_20855 [Virgibacillus sp. CM-4]MYL43580.1 thiamine-phosphate kinase [Virgibacillus massiliensis]GGJ76564.1 thiamine-monophosphate kinase [Virgibacillus kapii]CDQ41452.1 Thiamine-monophosphate kinase [Virgibacillus massiliensis]